MSYRYILFFFIGFLVVSCQSDKNSGSYRDTNFPDGRDLAITWELESNFVAEEPMHRSVFTIQNNSKYEFGERGWTLYYNQITRNILPKSYPETVSIEQINGDFYRLQPQKGFKLAPGETITVTYDSDEWIIKEGDAPIGLYMVFVDESGEELVRVPMQNYRIKPFTEPKQINRFKQDEEPIPTAARQFEQNSKLSLLTKDSLPPLFPSPQQLAKKEGSLILNQHYMVHFQPLIEKEAETLIRSLLIGTALSLESIVSETIGPNIISLKKGLVEGFEGVPESYQLDISAENGIQITGTDEAGIFYGIQSLLALLPVEGFRQKVMELELPLLTIHDAPRFPYRGLHLDVARNFQTKETLFKTLDLMAFYKLNKFHLRLTDDEGWRIEIEDLPELTEIGGFRGHTLTSKEHLPPAYGSGAFTGGEDSHGSGFYSREDMIEIIKYATDRHIEVIPEICVPGHARAAIKSMEVRYERLMAEGREQEALEYRLIDPNDRSEYISAQRYTDNVICICQESTYRFYEKVVETISDIYYDAEAPLRIFHTGGDETPEGSWKKSPLCAEFIKNHQQINRVEDLEPYFFGRILNYISERNIVVAGWEEVTMKKDDAGKAIINPFFADGRVQSYVWNNLWDNQDLGYRLANAGYPVVLCNVSNLYFDLAYNKDPKEPGLYWAGFVNTRDAFELMPFDVFNSTRVDDMGRPFDPDKDFGNMVRLRPSARKNILGIQGQTWSETIKGSQMLEYYLLPKLLALSERAWAPQPEWATISNREKREAAEDDAWNVFANIVGQRELPRLDFLFGGFNYRIPPPGIMTKNGLTEANVAFPGLSIHYSNDMITPDRGSNIYEGSLIASDSLRFRIFNTDGRGNN